jgi:hypothetical protein
MYICRGEMAEWSIAAVLKTVDCNRSGGSNPSLSAETLAKQNAEKCKSPSNTSLTGFLL